MAGAQNPGKKTKGRQKIEMKRIENEDDRLITFSKRRSGIYKKASELVTLTGAELAFLVYSPAGKPFSFAHPSMDIVANRFLGKDPAETSCTNPSTYPIIEAHRLMRIEELNQQHNDLLDQLEMEKEKGKKLKQKHAGNERKAWWDTPIEELTVPELLQMEAACNEIRVNLINKLKERNNNGASSSSAAAAVAGPDAGQPSNNDLYAAHMVNPFASSSDVIDQNFPSFPPGFDYGHGQI